MEPPQQTLVVSQSCEPVNIVSWHKAVTMRYLGKCEVIEEYDRYVKTPSVLIKVPAVVRLTSTYHRHVRAVKFSRVNIYERDKYSCQYCGVTKSVNGLTYDHVVPRARGGKTTWTNIVTCCEACNRKKANCTLAEAGMRLFKTPEQPRAIPVLVVARYAVVPEAWRDYLYWLRDQNERAA